MKIFLNERVIRLAKLRPSGREFHMVSTVNEITLLYNAFEADPTRKELVFFGADYQQLKSQFFSLFNIVIAAGGFIKNEKNETLFIYRRGHWDLPKGKLNTKKGSAEKKKMAAIREVMEETGIGKIDIVGKKPRTYHIFFEKRERYLKKTYWYEMRAPSDQALKPQEEEDITEVRWVSKDELEHVLEGTYPSLLKLFR